MRCPDSSGEVILLVWAICADCTELAISEVRMERVALMILINLSKNRTKDRAILRPETNPELPTSMVDFKRFHYLRKKGRTPKLYILKAVVIS